jgi:hypothetical protein
MTWACARARAPSGSAVARFGRAETNSPGARYRTGAYQFWRLHLTNLLTEAGVARPRLRAELVLAPLAAQTFRHLRDGDDGIAIAATLTALALAPLDRPQ